MTELFKNNEIQSLTPEQIQQSVTEDILYNKRILGGSVNIGNIIKISGDRTSSEILGSKLRSHEIYGDGSDGSVSITSNTSLTRDVYYTDITISNNAHLDTAGYRLFFNGTLTIESESSVGKKPNNGTTATGQGGAVGGAALSAGYYPACEDGKSGSNGGNGGSNANGTNGNAGNSGDSTTISAGANGVAGGNSGAGGAGGAFSGGSSATGGVAGTATQSGSLPHNFVQAKLWIDFSNLGSLAQYTSTAGSGSGAGGGGGANQWIIAEASSGGCGCGGGGSGSTGGIVGIFGRVIVNNGTIYANGGNGGNGANGGNASSDVGAQNPGGGGGGGGGGAAGSGGILILAYNSYSGSGTLSYGAGTSGTGGDGGSGINGGGDGSAGASGATGNSGVLFEFKN